MAKPFFYRIDAGPFLATVMRVPETHRGDWLTQMAFDLVDGQSEDPYVQSLIDEVKRYREIKAAAGSVGGKAKASKT